jgi:hypothetical protein
VAYDEKDADAPAPSTLATRKGEGVMDAEDLKATIAPVLTDAVSYVDSVLSPEREKATDYYLGKPFGNEEEGRSQVVVTELRDTVSGQTPDLLKLFFGPERTVEFLPKVATPEAMLAAKQRTDYVHFTFTERNNGFLETLSVLKDGLIRKIGIFKTWWDDSSEVRAYTLRNVTEDELTVLASHDGVNLLGVKKAKDGTSTVHMTRAMPGRIRVKALPPEEFLYNRTASGLDSFLMLGHRMRKTRGELLALGVSEADIDEYGSDATTLETNTEAIARRPDGAGVQKEVEAGDANTTFEYTEAYMHVDVDGDGIAELRQICTLGAGHHVVNGDGLGEPVDDHPFAIFIPDPEPHTLHGLSMMDRTGDMQLMKSSVLRAQADSLAAAIFPRLAYVEGQANVNDILNVEIGAPIRMRSVGAVTPIVMPYSGEMATPMLQYLDEVVERRTGRSKGAEGLDADALQSTTAQGVDAAVAGARGQTEMLARIFAEMTLKPLFRRMYRLIQQNQPQESVKLRDRVVSVDPNTWEPDLDVTVNVALGADVQRKLQTIGAALAKQEQVLQLMGPQNPIVHMSMYAATLQRGVELGGFPDVESFFKSVAPDWQPPQAPPEPSPEMAMVQIEQAKSQHAAQMKELELQQKQQQAQQDLAMEQAKMQQQYELEIAKMRQKTELEAAQLEAQFNAQVNVAQINAQVQASLESARLDAENQRHAATLQAEAEKHRIAEGLKHDRETESMRLEHERALEIARIQASAKTGSKGE